jgi:hypothetical protein
VVTVEFCVINSSWEEPESLSDYHELSANSLAKDFYFATIIDFDGLTMVAIVPKSYFDKYGCMWNQSMDLHHILPSYLDTEFVDGIYDVMIDIEKVYQDLIKLGFEENEDLLKLLIEYYS